MIADPKRRKRIKFNSPGYPIIDTHAHLCDPLFDSDREEVLERAKGAGVSVVIAVGEDLSDGQRNIDLAEKHPEVRPAAGLYPSHLDPDAAQAMAAFIRRERRRLIAVGEVGLDYWIAREERDRECQREILRGFIRLALELDLPLNVHSRSAGLHAISLLLENGARRVQLHAFDGKAASAMTAVEAGYFFSIPPSIQRSRQKQKLVRQLPLSCLLIETDSPVLGPDPENRNEPANAAIAVDTIAQIKNIHREEVLEKAFENSHSLFGDLDL